MFYTICMYLCKFSLIYLAIGTVIYIICIVQYKMKSKEKMSIFGHIIMMFSLIILWPLALEMSISKERFNQMREKTDKLDIKDDWYLKK